MSARPSARPSVCHTPVYSVETAKHIIKRFFFNIGYPDHSSFAIHRRMAILRRVPLPNKGVQCNMKWRFSTNISLYLGNDARQSHSYYRIKLSNDTSLNDLEWPLTQISRSRYYSTSNNSKRYKIELYLQWRTNRKSYMVYRTAPFSVTLNNQFSISRYYLTLNILFKDTTIVTMQDE